MTKVYLVGGKIRDRILGVPSKDMDYSVEAESFDAMREFIVSNGGMIFLETPEYATIRARLDNNVSDYVLCRKDGSYSDGRHPDSIEAGTIYDDLARRDFTMNAIAQDVKSGDYVDPHNGIYDISRRYIQCVGNTEERIKEDYLRLIRAARFSVTKNMVIDSELDLMINNSKMLDNMIMSTSIDRIREEVYKMFVYDTPTSFEFMQDRPNFRDAIFSVGIWLLPTTKERP